jgi:Zn-dependent peptidase ImmA (M78 family)
MALIAQEPRIFVRSSYIIGDDSQPVVRLFPIGDELGHVVIHRDVGVFIHGAAHRRKIPSPVVV